MSTRLTSLEQQARSLAPDERTKVADVGLESPHGTPHLEIDAAWQREFAERVAAYDRGETQAYMAEEVFAAAKLQGTQSR
ncbi:MAG: addiction module protein [Burkholderiales bacterium]|nr:addiction module protein [Burkholderiales bacterium]